MVIYESVAGKEIESPSMQIEVIEGFFCHNWVSLKKINWMCTLQMDLISLQLLHQQPYFTACGFFKIDMTLAFAVII